MNPDRNIAKKTGSQSLGHAPHFQKFSKSVYSFG